MSRKESKFYVTNFIDPQTIFLKRKFQHHVQWKRIFRYCIKKVSRKEGDVCKNCKWNWATLLLIMLRYIGFLMQFYVKCCTCKKCIFKLHLTLKMFFSWCFFFLHPDYIFILQVIWKCIDENVLLVWSSWWQESYQVNENIWSNSK